MPELEADPAQGRAAVDNQSRRPIEYTVDGEPQFTEKPDLAVREILVKAGVDPADHYLVELKEPKPIEYRDLDQMLHLHENERFVTVHHGPAPVS
jgi:hypothetical protein